MRVIDTSAWIEWLIDSPLGRKLAREIPDRAECVVPTIVQLELAKWLTREAGEDQADQMIAFTQKCVVAPLDTRIALLAADLHHQYKLATADAVVYATAREYGAELLTCDAHFKDLPGVLVVGKSDRP
jgi:predicted nucleic acid-binding protein